MSPRKRIQNLALTIKYNPIEIPNTELKDVYKYVMNFYIQNLSVTVKACTLELDSLQKLHLHAHITCPADIPYSSFYIRTFNIYVKKITNQNGWYSYIYKSPHEVLTPRQLIWRSPITFHSVSYLLGYVYDNHIAKVTLDNGDVVRGLYNVPNSQLSQGGTPQTNGRSESEIDPEGTASSPL